MTADEKKARRYLLLAVLIVVGGIVAFWLRRAGQMKSAEPARIARAARPLPPPQRRERRRVRRTPGTIRNPGSRVGILVEYMPQGQMPPGGYAMDYKAPFESVPGWLANAGHSFEIDRRFGAVAVRVAEPGTSATVLPPGGRGTGNQPAGSQPTGLQPVLLSPYHTAALAVRGSVELSSLPALAESFSSQTAFLEVYSDPFIVYDADTNPTCQVPLHGNSGDVAKSVSALSAPTSNDVLVAIMDVGFNKDYVKKFEPSLSYTAANGTGSPGSVPNDEHGNMAVYDASLAGLDATFLDMRLGDPVDLRLSDAKDAYSFLTAKLASDPTIKTRYQGMVVSNSWVVGFKDDNLPAGSAQRYFDNPNHFFTVAARELVAAGADVVFAAGNAGDCSASTAGTIWGASSLDEVISVAAVDKSKARIYYSSEGPGALSANKPDISAFSEFFGSDSVDPDSGTSAAAAVVAGVVAAIRAQSGWGWSSKSPAQLKQHLIDSADKDVMQGGSLLSLTGWTREFGSGVARVP